MIDAAEVLHVARLARLKLTDEETAKMAGELSSILGHIEQMSALDLEGVPPTSHVVEVEPGLRPDEPGECRPRELALAPAPAVQDDGFLVPSPQAG